MKDNEIICVYIYDKDYNFKYKFKNILSKNVCLNEDGTVRLCDPDGHDIFYKLNYGEIVILGEEAEQQEDEEIESEEVLH